MTEVLLIGGNSSGKSLLVQRLQALCTASPAPFSTETLPTTGVRLSELPVAGGHVTLREVGSAMRPTWPAYYGGAAGVVVRSWSRDEAPAPRIMIRGA